ncbi:MAG: amine dehydrogenase large subunit [Pseudomonadales bacterium]
MLQVSFVRALAAGIGLLLCTGAATAELQPEPVPNVVRLETPYPSTYAVVHDFAFGSLIDSKFSLVDIETRQFKGMLSAGQFATINLSLPRQKFYVGETVHSRGTRGARQDLIAVYDFATLGLVADIELPPRRANTVINLANTAITSDDRFLLVFNMNPATSVTVVDLDRERVAGEIATPGCSLVYPDEHGGFFMLCGNGGLLSISLDEQGRESGRAASEPFNDIDADPISEKAALIDGVWYFFTYGGEVQPIDVRDGSPQIGKRWWLASAEERADNWRPAGWHGVAGHPSGLLWVGMTPDGYNGSHKDPAPQIWLFDAGAQRLIRRFGLKTPALSITATADENPRLLVVNVDGALDVYDGRTGEYLRSVYELGDTPYMVHAVGGVAR